MNSTRKIRRNRKRNKESGIAMIIALLALMLLAMLGMGFMFMANTENSVNGNYKDSEKAYYASRAGLENVRALLFKNTPLYNQAIGLTMPAIGAGTGMIYVYNSNGSSVVDPTSGPTSQNTNIASNPTLDDELCHEQFAGLLLTVAQAGTPCAGSTQVINGTANVWPTYFQLPNPALTTTDIPSTGTSAALPFKWVRITNKQNLMGLSGQLVTAGQPNNAQVCWDGNNEVATNPGNCGGLTPSANPVWVLTSLALTTGGSRRMTQMEVAYTPPLIVPGTISTQAPVTLQGSYSLQSYDNCSCSCTTDSKTGVTSCTTRAGFTQCNNQAHVIYTAGTVNVNGSSGQVISNWGNNATSASLQNQSWPYNVNNLIDQFKAGAANAGLSAPWNYNCTGTPNFTSTPEVYAACGTQSSQQFGTFPPNLLSSNGADNSGAVQKVVYVPGSVKLTSDSNGAGVLIVDGDLEINGGLNFYGLLLVRGKVSFTGGGSQAVNLYGSILAGEDVSATDQSLTDTFGGSINFKYDRCALNFSTPPGPPTMLATHEVIF